MFNGLEVDSKQIIGEEHEGCARDMTTFERLENIRMTQEFNPFFNEFKSKLYENIGITFDEYSTRIETEKDRDKFYNLIVQCHKNKKTVEETIKMYKSTFRNYGSVFRI